MYKLKYYMKGGTYKVKYGKNLLSLCKSLVTPSEYEKLKQSQVLDIVMKSLKQTIPNIYKIEIINTKTNGIIDYIDESEVIIDGTQGHLLYDKNGKIINCTTTSNCPYRFKYYYNDGTIKLSSAKATSPNELCNDFEGLINQKELNNLNFSSMTTKAILKTAIKAYKGFLPDFYRIEIINEEKKEIVDYIDVKEVK